MRKMAQQPAVDFTEVKRDGRIVNPWSIADIDASARQLAIGRGKLQWRSHYDFLMSELGKYHEAWWS
jgi:hypothetical protein